MKKSRRVISLILCLVMTLTTFCGVGVLPSIKADAAGTTLSNGTYSFTQERVVSDYATAYPTYKANYLNGTSEATNLVLPGLNSTDDYIPQGMTYYAAKNWVLISAYSNGTRPTAIFALDADNGAFVNAFLIKKENGQYSTSHGGGLTVSENNLYFADSSAAETTASISNIAYIPLSQLDVEEGTVQDIQFEGSVDLNGELGGTATSYCCYDEGVLWTGNFYRSGTDYDAKADSTYPSFIMGYKLSGSTSEEEWANLTKTKSNLIKVTSAASQNATVNGSTMTYQYKSLGDFLDIVGNVTLPTTSGAEVYTTTTANVTLTEGTEYTIEYDTNTRDTDLYLMGAGHVNTKNFISSTPNEDGLYHCKMTFVAGVNPGADSSWPATLNGDETEGTVVDYSGSYSIRVDQDNVTSAHDFAIKNLRISTNGVQSEVKDCATVPSYCIITKDFDSIQYATVDRGRFYLSRSWGRTNESTLDICEIDLSLAGDTDLVINGAPRKCYLMSKNDNTKEFTNLPMSEALCIVDSYLYMTFEGAANKYKNGTDNLGISKCSKPIDVVWKIDQYTLMGEKRPTSKDLSCYERVYDLNKISAQDDYLIVYESDTVDTVTGNKNIYALNAYGGYNGERMPKSTQANGTNDKTLDSMGMIPQTITDYHKDGDYLYLENPDKDDNFKNRWNIIGAGTDTLQIRNNDMYYNKYNLFYFGSRLMYMTTNAHGNLSRIKLTQSGDVANGDFNFYYLAPDNTKKYYLWCNDGSNQSYMNAYDSYYAAGDKYVDKYTGLSEVAGTFHSDGANLSAEGSSGNRTGGAVDAELMNFHIYRRVTTAVSKTGGSGLYNTMNASLQADGTYTLNMQSYATGSTHNYVENKTLPTDFVFLLDASSSMEKNTDVPVFTYVENGALSYNNTGAGDDGEKYYLYEGKYYLVEHYTTSSWGTLNSNKKCYLNIDVDDGNGGTKQMWLCGDGLVETEQNKGRGTSTVHYTGPYYQKTTINRLTAAKNSFKEFISDINTQAQEYGTSHRISLIQYGCSAVNNNGNKVPYYNTGFYNTDSSSFIQYNGDANAQKEQLAKSFYAPSHQNLTAAIDSITSPDANDADTYSNLGFEMAVQALASQSPAYGGTGDKYYSDWTDANGVLHEKNAQAVVIMLTDGVPGIGNDATEATTVANSSMGYSKILKDAGATVFSIQIGTPTLSGFDQTTYIKAVSSDYPQAENMTTLGSVTDTGYSAVTEQDGKSVYQESIQLDSIFTKIANSNVNTSTSITLNTDSIVRQTLADEFKLTDSSTVKATFTDIYTNAMGNTAFSDPVEATGVTASKDIDANSIEVKGFDFSSNYFAKGHDGKALNIEITGVLLDNPYISGSSMDISKDTDTAVYENQEQLDANKQFRGFPNVNVNILEKTYVLDYGIPMVRSTSDYGKPVSLDIAPNKQDVNNYTTSLDYATGTQCSIQGSESITATLSSTSQKDTAWVLYKVNGHDGYEWAKVNIMPASNVLYEESALTDGKSGSVSWTTDGTAKAPSQSVSTSSDVYGYDSAYASDTDFSNGSALKATVSSSSQRTNTKVFTFTGDSFDLMSACGKNTGMLLVTVKNSSGALVKGYIVDTYYRDTDNLGNNGLLSQIPVVSFKGDYGTYTVEVVGAYLKSAGAIATQSARTAARGAVVVTFAAPQDADDVQEVLAEIGIDDIATDDFELVWFDSNSVLNGGTGAKTTTTKAKSRIATFAADSTTALDCYIDSIRVYNPLGTDYTAYNNNEKNAAYYNVIEHLKGDESLEVDGFAFVESPANSAEGVLNFAKYQQFGPKNEFYLKKATDGVSGLTFKVSANDRTGGLARVMLGLRSVSGKPVSFKVNDAEVKTISTATEMYYDITDCIDFDESGVATVTIVNTGDAVLAVNNIKLTDANLTTVSEEDMSTVYNIMTAPVQAADVYNGVIKVADDAQQPETPDNSDNNGDTSSSFDLITMIINIIKQVFESLFKTISLGEVK